MNALVTAPNAAIPAGLRRRQAFDAEPKTLYVHRPVKNADAILAWAKGQGFKSTLPADDLHVTVAFSKQPIDWNAAPDGFDSEVVPAAAEQKNGARSVERLGDKGAVVLRFESPDLASRWRQFRRAGASWEHDGYRPHVTISYDAGGVDLSKVQPYDGPIELGEEAFGEVNPKWMEKVVEQAADSRFEIAMDKDSVREKRRDGQLVVKRTPISKANVSPYLGKEIPGWEALGLDPKRVYYLLRDPEELAKAAPTSNGVQLLIIHTPVSAEDHRPDETVGSLGTDAEWDGEYLWNSLFVNAARAIRGIETNEQRELSAGYHYVPDMTPGNFRGSAYDGVMRDIVFNHVALVEDGRAGPDVVVGDGALKEHDMKATRFGARTLSITAAAFAPLLAMDQKVSLPKGLFAPLTTKTYKAGRDALLAGVRSAVDGKLRAGIALDASMEDFAKALDTFSDDMAAGVDEEAPADAIEQMDAASSVEPAKAITQPGATYDAEPMKAFMKQCGMDDASIAKCMDMMPKPPALDEEPDDEAKKKAERERAEKEKQAKDAEMDKDKVTTQAMDAALKAQSDTFQRELAKVRDNERGVRAALHDVKPWVGDLPTTMAFDTAADVYRHACVMREVKDAKTLHADALAPILRSLPRAGARAPDQQQPAIAMDSSTVSLALKIAPGVEHISTTL